MWKKLLCVSCLPILLTITGCAGLSKKFTSVEKVNLDPFATITITMINSIDYGLDRSSSILTKPYLKPDGKPDLQRLYELDNQLYRVLKGIEGYSINIVSLSSSSRSPKQKVDAFANYVEMLDKPALEYHIAKRDMQDKEFMAILSDIRLQEDLLSAMKAAQPIIDLMLQYVDLLTEDIRQHEIKAENEIENAIDNDYAVEITYVKALQTRRDRVMKALIAVNEYYEGHDKAIKQLNRNQSRLLLGIKLHRITKSNIKQFEQDLIRELSGIQHQLDLLEKDSDYYMKIHQELDELVKFHDQEVRKAKGIIQLWAGAHTKMANGVTDPADWFDVTDPGSELFGLVKSVLNR